MTSALAARSATSALAARNAARVLAVAVLLGVACRPGGEAEPATAASGPDSDAAPTSAPSSPPAGPRSEPKDPERDETTLASGAADPEPAIADDPIAERAPSEPPKQQIPDEPYKVLILGDSLAATGFGALLERKLDQHPHIQSFRKGKSASGLARPDFFDWVAEGKRQVTQRQPDLVIVVMGGNDGQDLTRTHGDKRVPWQHATWAESYRERMDTFLSEISAPERKILWLGLPHMGLRSLEKKLVLIRGIQKEAVEAMGSDATYLETIPYVTDDEGNMLESAPVGKRAKVQKIRAEDKIHFTMSGSEYFAERVYPDVLEVLALPDVEEETPVAD